MTSEQVRAVLETLAPTQEKVDLAVKAAVDIAQPSRVIVFGSWARGEAEWDSDVDLAVVVRDSAESQLTEIRRNLRRRLDQFPMTIDLVLTTEAYMAQFGDEINSIYYRILKDGKVAYEQRQTAGSPDAIDQGR